ncbi:TetR/AcrR family transcriptional regulator [Bacillus badius]|uniref:Transcriptional regulator, TetR family n=1 Tax=Bacillus badius TaxID=1455 RepID=A0ABR5APH6_BACBA|nr:TetR/AcrR family transcriptional regulator [Bacillus badius]KIL74145.1 Transcriptional regulator, TetR family [Bacillus badius]MED4718373.1 TetR/AcrR family transcriptional regulator [Bacillus badius]
MRKNKMETDATVQKLLSTARKHFTEKGYANTALEDIVTEANLTRGALYHHFKHKKGLFLHTFELVQKEIGERVEKEALKSEDPWQQLLLGCQAFLSAAVEEQNLQILLIDGPAVLGWDVFRLIDEQNSMRHLREQLQDMKNQGYLKPLSVDAITHCLSGAMNEAALWIADNTDKENSLADTIATITNLLEGLKN